jgi:hypothetical protein
MRRIPTAPVAAGSLLASWAIVEASGSRPAGGAVLAVGGLWCIREWYNRHDRRTALTLGGVGFGSFVVSHVLSLAIGPWPSVLLVSAAMAAAAWSLADAREQALPGLAVRPPTR